MKQLCLADQGHGVAFGKAVKQLSAARKTLRIQTGETGKWGFGMKDWVGGKPDENDFDLFGGFDDLWSFNGGRYF